MTTTTIHLWTSAADAVRHSCQHGWRRLDLDASTLTDAQRELLATLVYERDGARVTLPESPSSIAPPTLEGLRAWLDARLQERADRDAAARESNEKEAAQAAEDDQRLSDLIERFADAPISTLLDDDHDLRLVYREEAGLEEALGRRFGRNPYYVTIARATGREEEAREALRVAKAAAEEAQAERKRAGQERRAAARQRLRSILLTQAPTLVPVYDDGMARYEDIIAALQYWCCARLGISDDDLVAQCDYSTRSTVDRESWDALQVLRAAVPALGVPAEVEIVETDDDDGDSLGCVIATFEDGENRYPVQLLIPISAVPCVIDGHLAGRNPAYAGLTAGFDADGWRVVGEHGTWWPGAELRAVLAELPLVCAELVVLAECVVAPTRGVWVA